MNDWALPREVPVDEPGANQQGIEDERFTTVQRLHEERKLSLMRRSPRQHPLFEILSVVARVAIGDGNEGWLGAGSFVGSSRILTTDRKRGRIDVYLLGLDSKDLTSPAGYSCKELRQIMLV